MRNLLLTILLVCTAAACFGQTTSGTILGNVTDSTGGVIPGASVVIENQGTGLTRNLTTDGRGSFLSSTLPIGTYQVTVSASGFGTAVKSDLILHVSDRMQLLYTLQPGKTTQTVKVTGETPLIQTASTTLGGVINKEQVANLPLNGRSVTELIALVPGVELRGTANQTSVGGKGVFTMEGGLHFLLDGGDASRVDADDLNNTYGSSAGRISRVSVDAVQEFRVSTDSYSAEYGATQGGMINLITKSGTNDMHGSLYEYFRNNVFDARDYFNPAPTQQPAYRLNQFGGSVGGPIVRNKLFYFGDYEGVRQRSGNVIQAVVPTADARAAALPIMQAAFAQLPLPNGPLTNDPRFGAYTLPVSNPLTENTYLIKMDYLMSAKDHLTGRFNLNKNLTDNTFGVATGQVQSAPGLMALAMIDYTHAFTPHVLNDATFYFNRFHVDPLSSDDPTVRDSPILNFGEGAGVGPGLFNIHIANNSFTYQDTLTWVHGHHQLKAGVGAIRNQVNKELGFQMLAVALSFANAQQNQSFVDLTIGYPRWGLRNTYWHGFIQDDYQVTPRLTLNMGLRYQYDTVFTESHGRISNFDFATSALTPVGDPGLDFQKLNFAPRFGFAYMLNDAGTTVLRGGYGIFYTNKNAGNSGQGLPTNVPGMGFSASVNVLQVPGLVMLPFPDLNSFAVPTTSFSALSRNWATPYSEKWNLNVQQALGRNAMFQVNYIGSHGVHLYESIDENRLTPGGGPRPLPQYGSITTNVPAGFSNYNSLQAILKKRFNNGMQVNVNYTWSHSLDDAPTIFASIQDDHNPVGSYGSSDFDVTHIFEVDGSYLIPAVPKIPKLIGGGWQYNVIGEMRSGFPFTVTCGCDPMGVGQTTGYADLVPGVDPRPTNFNIPYNQLNPAAFAIPVGHWGDMGRNSLRGPDNINFDMSIFKNFDITDKQHVMFRAEAFDIFNHPQFQNPQSAMNNIAQFGQTLATVSTSEGFHTSRQLQFALRYFF